MHAVLTELRHLNMDYAIQLAERDEAMDHIKREQRAAAERFDTLQVRGWQCGRRLLFGRIEGLRRALGGGCCRRLPPSIAISGSIEGYAHLPHTPPPPLQAQLGYSLAFLSSRRQSIMPALCPTPNPHYLLLQARLGSLATETAALREDNEVLTHLLVETKVLYAEQLSKAFPYLHHPLV